MALQTLLIEYDDATGRLLVDGPIHDEALCDFMMKKASRIIENECVKAAQAQASEATSPVAVNEALEAKRA